MKLSKVWTTAFPLKTITVTLEYPLTFTADVPAIDMFDLDYITNHSGDKAISPLVEFYLDEDGEISNEGKINLCKHIYQTFGEKWNRLYKMLLQDYDALENYDRNESVTTSSSGTGSGVMSGKQKNTQTLGDVTNEETTSAFDSPVYQPVAKNTTHLDGNNTSETEYQNVTNTKTDSNTSTTTSRIHGNIGVTTSTQMLVSEWTERNKIIFKEQVYADMDSILTLPLYEN